MFNQNNVTQLRIPRSFKKISPIITTTFNAGDFVPFFNMEIIPNDRISLNIKSVTNMQTPNFATMDTLYQHVSFFYCPNRLVHKNWDKFYGDGKTNDYETFVQLFIPQLTCPEGGFAEKTIADYLGVPTKKEVHNVSAIPFRMVAMIYNEYYRDEQRMAKAIITTDDTDQTGTNGDDWVNDLQNGGKVPKTCRLWDYFTGTKLEFQAGEPITIPVLGEAPVVTTPEDNDSNLSTIAMKLGRPDGNGNWNYPSSNTFLGNATNGQIALNTGSAQFTPGNGVMPTNLVADLSLTSGLPVRDFKYLLMAQQALQNIEDGGSRYIEQLFKRWGVYANELELEIPKWLGSRTTILNMNMVVGTAGPTQGVEDYEFGQLGGMSNTYDNGFVFQEHFKQHGYLFGIVTIRPYNTYENGIPKQLVKHTIDDYYKPEMAYFGPDIVRNYEIYSDKTDGKDDEMFGVRNYGDDLRFIPNRVTGQMRTNATYSQAYKTYSINYANRPINNEEFILQSQNQVDKTLRNDSTTMDQFIFQAKLEISMTRNLPKNPQAEQLIRI